MFCTGCSKRREEGRRGQEGKRSQAHTDARHPQKVHNLTLEQTQYHSLIPLTLWPQQYHFQRVRHWPVLGRSDRVGVLTSCVARVAWRHGLHLKGLTPASKNIPKRVAQNMTRGAVRKTRSKNKANPRRRENLVTYGAHDPHNWHAQGQENRSR